MSSDRGRTRARRTRISWIAAQVLGVVDVRKVVVATVVFVSASAALTASLAPSTASPRSHIIGYPVLVKSCGRTCDEPIQVEELSILCRANLLGLLGVIERVLHVVAGGLFTMLLVAATIKVLMR